MTHLLAQLQIIPRARITSAFCRSWCFQPLALS